MKYKGRLLLVDDDVDFATTLSEWLVAKGFQTGIVRTAGDAMTSIGDEAPDCVLLDIGLPDLSGMDLIGRIAELDAKLPVVMVTGVSKLDTAIDAIKKGAYDYIVKPIDHDALLIKVVNAVESRRAFRTIAQFERDLTKTYGFDKFIFKSDLMKSTVEHLRLLAENDSTVLVSGESGVGKELAAKTIHYNGPRRLAPFVAISCAAVPETLIENELFGHEKGSFTDAFERQHGKFEHASGGTIFLDEIGDLPASMQTKLLRVLQERTFNRIGGTRDIKVDVRVIAATNIDLVAAVAQGTFRSDLFYRLSVLPIEMPSLRERPDDIMPLADHFIGVFAGKVGKKLQGFSKGAREKLMAYHWPGNVRELQNAIERAAVMAKQAKIRSDDIALGAVEAEPAAPRLDEGGIESLEDLQAAHIRKALQSCDWNISRVAGLLGIGRDTLYRKIRQFGIKR